MNDHIMSDEYKKALNNSIEKDRAKIRELGIDPSRLVNSIYDVLEGKEPLYEGMEFSEEDADRYFVKFATSIEWMVLA